MKSHIEILYITWNRLAYTKLTLPRVLDQGGDADYKVCIVDNGSKDGTVEYLKSLSHPRIKNITFKGMNHGISPVTNEFWEQAQAEYMGKVDNDILLPNCWLEPIMYVHAASDPNVGVVGITHFDREDIDKINELDYLHNIKRLRNGAQVFVQYHIGGACYVFPRELFRKFGPVPVFPNAPTAGWAGQQIRFFKKGYFPCYVYPWITCKHLGDKRYPETLFELDPEETEQQCALRKERHEGLLASNRPGMAWDRRNWGHRNSCRTLVSSFWKQLWMK